MDVKLNLIDRAIGFVSPAAGVRRMVERSAMSAASAMTSEIRVGGLTAPSIYDAGRRGGIKGVKRRPRSANVDYIGGQTTLIGQSRYAAANMPLATAAIERPVEFIIGTGLMAIPDVDADEVGLTPEALAKITKRMRIDYDEYMASKDPDAEQSSTGYGQQEIILRGELTSGDMLVVRVMPEQRGRRHATAWKLFEADWIMSPVGHTEGQKLASGPWAGKVCIAGVVQDDYGAPLAFGVLKRDPGAFNVRTSDDVMFIDAWGEQSGLPTAFLVAKKKRANQTRGVPFLAPVLDIVQKVSTLTRAEAFAAVLSAMLVFTHKSPGAQAMPEPVYAAEGDDGDRIVTGGMAGEGEGGVAPEYQLEEGSILDLDLDHEVEAKTPGRPNPAFDPFFMGLARQIGAATGIPVEVLLLHFLSSYTASRAAFESLYQILVKPRREWLIGQSEQLRYASWLYEQVARGRYKLPGYLTDENKRAAWSRVRFRGDGKLSMDPAREAKALEIHEAHAWTTGQQITADLNGGDYDANVTVRIGEHQRFVDGGLPIPNVVGGGNGVPEATDTTDNIAGSGSADTGGTGKEGN